MLRFKEISNCTDIFFKAQTLNLAYQAAKPPEADSGTLRLQPLETFLCITSSWQSAHSITSSTHLPQHYRDTFNRSTNLYSTSLPFVTIFKPSKMADGRQEPYDPYLPSTANAQGGNARTAALQAVSSILRSYLCNRLWQIRHKSVQLTILNRSM